MWATTSAADSVGSTGGGQGKSLRTDVKMWSKKNRKSFWSIEPDVGRVAHGIPKRVDRIRGLGNAIVPQIAEQIGRVIKEIDDASRV